MVDIWTYGCVVYQMIAGHSPFCHKNQKTLYDTIRAVASFVINRETTTIL